MVEAPPPPRAFPTCSQLGGHRRDLPVVLRALHGLAVPAARLGAGRLHVQVRQLYAAGERAGGRNWGAKGRSLGVGGLDPRWGGAEEEAEPGRVRVGAGRAPAVGELQIGMRVMEVGIGRVIRDLGFLAQPVPRS